MEANPKTEIIQEEYCKGCPDFEPEAVKMYCMDVVVECEIVCRYGERCRRIAEWIRKRSGK